MISPNMIAIKRIPIRFQLARPFTIKDNSLTSCIEGPSRITKSLTKIISLWPRLNAKTKNC